MNKTNVPVATPVSPEELLQGLQHKLGGLTPELQKAATYVLENPNDVGVSSIREIALAANVKPNTLVRMAANMGLDGYEAFREPFRQRIRDGDHSFPNRARWLQSLSRDGALSELYTSMAERAIANIETLFASASATQLEQAAQCVLTARATYVLGVGVANPIARNFAYLTGMAVGGVHSIPRDGSLPVDGLARAQSEDVLIAMTFKPYRREVIEAVQQAQAQGMMVIAISDSPAAPIIAGAVHSFIVPTESPQFFTSTVALAAFFETLTAYIVAGAGEEAVQTIEQFHSRRRALGIYQQEEE